MSSDDGNGDSVKLGLDWDTELNYFLKLFGSIDKGADQKNQFKSIEYYFLLLVKNLCLNHVHNELEERQ